MMSSAMNSVAFNHSPLNLFDEDAQITQVNGKTRRYYETQFGKFASITSVLSAMTDKTFLFEWKKRIGEDNANRISRQAAQKGTYLHSIIEHYLNNDPGYSLIEGSQNRLAMAAFKKVKPVLDNRIGNIFALEKKLFSKKLRIAGTVDFIAEFDGVLSIIDFKSSIKPKRREYIHNYFIQETAYSLMLQDMSHHNLIADQLVTLIMPDTQSDTQIFIEKRDTWMKETINMINRYHKKYGVEQ